MVGEGTEIFIFLRHLAEQILCVAGDFWRFQKSFVNFMVRLKNNELKLQNVGRKDRQYFSNILCEYIKHWISYKPSQQIDP